MRTSLKYKSVTKDQIKPCLSRNINKKAKIVQNMPYFLGIFPYRTLIPDRTLIQYARVLGTLKYVEGSQITFFCKVDFLKND